MSGRTDWLVQRYIPTAPNSMVGAWIDEGVARELGADEADEAIRQLADPRYEGKRRAIKWDHVIERETVPTGGVDVLPSEKEAPDPDAAASPSNPDPLVSA